MPLPAVKPSGRAFRHRPPMSDACFHSPVLEFPVRPLVLALLLSVPFLAAAQPSAGPETVVASRGGVSITLADVDARMLQLPPEARAGYLRDPERMQRLLDGLLLARQAAREAEKQGLAADPLLERQLQLARETTLMQRWYEDLVQNAEVPDLEAAAHEIYLARPGDFSRPERRTLQHVLIKLDGRGLAEAQDIGREVRAKALAGTPFDELVAEYTEEGLPGERSNGWLRDVSAKQLTAAFSEVAFALEEPGAISEPFRSPHGVHVVRLDSVKPAEVMPYELVKQQIIDAERKKYVDRVKVEATSRFQAQPVEADSELLLELRDRYDADGVKAAAPDAG